jgi:hypothetical protein
MISPVYEPIARFTTVSDPTQLTNNLAAAFYPKDVFAIEDLYDAYLRADTILNRANWAAFNTFIVGYEEWRGAAAVPSSRWNHPSGRYPARPPIDRSQLNNQNSFYDWYDPDDYFFVECVSQGRGLNAGSFPGGPFTFYDPAPPSGFFISNFPATPAC